jgi:hypothetical protein
MNLEGCEFRASDSCYGTQRCVLRLPRGKEVQEELYKYRNEFDKADGDRHEDED